MNQKPWELETAIKLAIRDGHEFEQSAGSFRAWIEKYNISEDVICTRN